MKKTLLLAFFALYCQARAQAPSNDNCGDAILLTVNADASCASMTSGTLVGATNSGVPSSKGVADDDVWYSFVATATVHKINLLNIQGTNLNLVHEVFEGNCGGQLISLSISDPNFSLMGGLTVGATYYVRVFTFNATPPDSTTFQICISAPLAPANDECTGAIALTVNTDANCTAKTSGTLVNAANSGIPGSIGIADDDVWYTFVATATSHGIQLSNVRGDITNLVHEVMDGTCRQLLSIASSDPNHSRVSGLTVGSLYYLRIYSFQDSPAQSTTFEVCINIPPPPPANDECAGAIGLTVNMDASATATVSGTLAYASNSQIAATRGTPDDDVWYSFVATATSHRISLTNIRGDRTNPNLVHEVMSDTCGQLTSIGISVPDWSIITGLTIGTTYYVRVFSYNNTPSSTAFDISVSIILPPPSNDDCTNAITLVPATSYAGGAVNSTVASATDSTTTSFIPDPGCGDYENGDVWYKVVIPADGKLTIETGSPIGSSNTFFDSGLAVYSGTCDNLVLVECNDEGPDEGFSKINLTGRTLGETVYVRIWNINNENDGAFSVSAWSPTLGVSTFNDMNFKAYPNPVNNILNLSYDQNISDVQIYNLLGQNVASESINNTSAPIDMSGLPSGSYLVKVTAEGQTKTIKVIKQQQ